MHNQVLCGMVPYWEITSEPVVIDAIINGKWPQKPEEVESLGFTIELWAMVEQCWSVNVNTRPDVKTMLSHISRGVRIMASEDFTPSSLSYVTVFPSVDSLNSSFSLV